jgi:hypothetical protein
MNNRLRCAAHKNRDFIYFLTLILIASYSIPVHALTCGQVRLVSASGVIGPVQKYNFTAVCTATATETQSGVFSSTSTNYGMTVEILQGKGEWNRGSGMAEEYLAVKGSYYYKNGSGTFSGQRVAKGICNQDPFLKDAPGGSGFCTGITVQYQAKSGPILENLVEPKQFFVQKAFSFVEAQALSTKEAAKAPPPPPPPPSPQPKKEPLKISDSLGAQGSMKAAPVAASAAAKPRLAVISHQASVEPNCQSPQPAMTVKLIIQNSGGPLSANKGTVFLKEFGGGNLSSGGVFLPALNATQQQTVSIPVISPQPYASLAGQHQLQVIFNANNEGGQPAFLQPPTPYKVIGTFPPNHCRAATRQPAGVPAVRKK